MEGRDSKNPTGEIETVSVNENIEKKYLESLVRKAHNGVIAAGFSALGVGMGIAEMQIGGGQIIKDYESPIRSYIGLGLLVTSLIFGGRAIYNMTKFVGYISKNSDEPLFI